jgi:hypothetical protein
MKATVYGTVEFEKEVAITSEHVTAALLEASEVEKKYLVAPRIIVETIATALTVLKGITPEMIEHCHKARKNVADALRGELRRWETADEMLIQAANALCAEAERLPEEFELRLECSCDESSIALERNGEYVEVDTADHGKSSWREAIDTANEIGVVTDE